MKIKLFRIIKAIKSREANKKKRAINHFLRQHMRKKKISDSIVKYSLLNTLFSKDAPKKSSLNEDKAIFNNVNNQNHIIYLPFFMNSKRYEKKKRFIFFDGSDF